MQKLDEASSAIDRMIWSHHMTEEHTQLLQSNILGSQSGIPKCLLRCKAKATVQPGFTQLKAVRKQLPNLIQRQSV